MATQDEPSVNAAQIEYWNATAGETWALFQEQLDRQIAPLGLEALRALAPAPGEAILDIGCGCGQTSLDLASHRGRRGGRRHLCPDARGGASSASGGPGAAAGVS